MNKNRKQNRHQVLIQDQKQHLGDQLLHKLTYVSTVYHGGDEYTIRRSVHRCLEENAEDSILNSSSYN